MGLLTRGQHSGVIGVAQNLDTNSIGVVVLGNFESLTEGDEVKRTGEVLSIPVGEEFLGRVINPLGQPIDGLEETGYLTSTTATELTEVPTSSALPASASQSAGITGACHHTQLIVVFLEEMRFHHVGHASLFIFMPVKCI